MHSSILSDPSHLDKIGVLILPMIAVPSFFIEKNLVKETKVYIDIPIIYIFDTPKYIEDEILR